LENELKQDLNAQIEHLSEELAAIQNDLSLLRENNAKSLKHLKEKHSFQIKSEERKNEKLTQENFQVTLENERLTSKFKILAESQKKLELECNQLKVEKQWLVNDKKKQSLNQSRFDEFAGEIEELNSQLKNEREKVKNLSDWKYQLVEKNKILKEENNRLIKKSDDLEHVMNDEFIDITEMIKTIDRLKDKQTMMDVKQLRRYV